MNVGTSGRVHSRALGLAGRLGLCMGLACASLLSSVVSRAAQPAAAPVPTPVIRPKTFATPEKAAEALILAAERFDIPAMSEIVGTDGMDLVKSEDPVQDKNRATNFAALARQRTRVVRDSTNTKVAYLVIGDDEWPSPVPIVEKGGKWHFDSAAGRQEILYRRIGENELDAIEMCRGYVEAQKEYASERHNGAHVNQYAQRTISTPGKQDGLAWRAADSTWQGPVGEAVAEAIEKGYTGKSSPYNGYYFKVLKKQGPYAPMGEMDFVVQGMMIGGFALVAAPADYAVTGVKTFIVSHDGVVYEKDLGPETVDLFRAMERFDPDPTWSPVVSP